MTPAPRTIDDAAPPHDRKRPPDQWRREELSSEPRLVQPVTALRYPIPFPMRSRLLHETGGLKTFLLVFDRGDEVMGELKRFARERAFSGSHFTAIGAFERAVLGYFDWQRKDYDRIPIDDQVEVLALTGDIALADGEPKVHAHAVLGNRKGVALGGHLLEAHVRPTLELTLTEAPASVQRRHDPETGLNLISLDRPPSPDRGR